MLTQGFELIKTTIAQVYPSPRYFSYFLFMLAALVFVLVRRRSKGEKLLCWYSVLLLLSFFFPLFAVFLSKFLREGNVYWRYLWLLPSAVLVSYAAVRVISFSPKKMLNVLTTLIIAAALVLGGKNLYAAGAFEKSTGREKLDARTMIAARVIDENIEETGNTHAYLAAPFTVSHEIRELTSNVKVYSRRILDMTNFRAKFPKWYYNIEVLNGARVDEEHKTARNLKRNNCNYVLVDSSAGIDEDLTKRGYEMIYDGGTWHIWYHKKVVNKQEAAARRAARREAKKNHKSSK